MEAIVLAGGLGTRIRTLLPDIPKVMAPIAGKPFIELVLQSLASRGFERIILSLGYKSEMIQSHFGSKGFAGMELVYQIEDSPLGTGGAIRAAMEVSQSDHVYVFNGDTYLQLEADTIEDIWIKSRCPIIIARKVSDTARYGRLKTFGNRVVEFKEKGPSGPGYINAGCYVFPREMLKEYPNGHKFSIEQDFLAPMVSQTEFNYFVTQGKFIDIGIPEDYQIAQRVLAEDIL